MNQNHDKSHHHIDPSTPSNIDLIADYCASLSLDFEAAITSDFPLALSSSTVLDDLSSLRLAYHRNLEATRTQILFTAVHLKRLHARIKEISSSSIVHPKFQVAIITSDVLPETGEYISKLLIDALVAPGNGGTEGVVKPDHILVMGRRGDVGNAFSGSVVSKPEWEEDPNALAGVSMVILVCSSMHLALVEEQIRSQDLSRIVLFACIQGVLHRRLCTLLKTENVLIPDIDFAMSFGNSSGKQDNNSGSACGCIAEVKGSILTQQRGK
ncbi:hypothetical protein HDU67_003039 [Dinochytrium kinnereticum]|nr:hypothetical protein HDU67_003039 [Dinochytrium kinnereticum]